MNKREILLKIIGWIGFIFVIISNIALFLCCLLVFKGIMSKQTDMIIFPVEMFSFFLCSLLLGKHFKKYLD
ncbi:hypothetical protein G9F72_023990 [Clostridium estertheticum]|uniref:hypothetical protein n=1 Tax=Clostridium estertheticum TaxID=238834 RepID=UPI0013E95EF2|nr:hypothetical protein [Clostridium estertheticum]MBZ9689362.1 hypothetical protein [Clostridium estertheticum]